MSNDAKTHTLAWIFHLRREARPPSAFLTCDHVQICTGRQGEGELVWVFYHFFISFSFFYPDYRPSQDAPDPNLLLKSHPKKNKKIVFLVVPLEDWLQDVSDCQLTSTESINLKNAERSPRWRRACEVIGKQWAERLTGSGMEWEGRGMRAAKEKPPKHLKESCSSWVWSSTLLLFSKKERKMKHLMLKNEIKNTA